MSTQDIDPRAVDDLARSGLTTTDMRAEPSMKAGFGTDIAGYHIPYFMRDGSRHPKMGRKRFLEPHPDGRKYDSPTAEQLAPDTTPPYFAPPETCDYSLPLKRKLIVEGEKKAVAAIKYLGVQAVGIGGCWNWSGIHDEDMKKTHRPHTLHPEIKKWLGNAKEVELAIDGDMATNENVAKAASALWWACRAEGINAVFVRLPPGMGMDDWIMAQPDGSALANFEALERFTGENLTPTSLPEMFRALGITTNNQGRAECNDRTLTRLMHRHPRYKQRLWVDMVKKRCMVDDEPFNDAITHSLLCELQEFFPTLSMNVCYQTLTKVAWERRRNLIAEWMQAQKWDGTPRLETFAATYLRAPPSPYLSRAFQNFMVAGVARMLKPGTKFDHMVVLQGKQGIGKTRAIHALFGTENVAIAPHTTAIGSRDWLDAGGSAWCLVLDELAGLSRVEHTELKSALSTESDTYRRAYRKDPETFPRMFVCAATTNEEVYLTDPTGNRRYWPVLCHGKVDVEGIARDRGQLWAEAFALHAKGFPFWDMPPEAEQGAFEAQEGAAVPDAGLELLEDVLARSRADRPECRPPVVLWKGANCYFVRSSLLMAALDGERAHNGTAKRVRSLMLKLTGWEVAVPRDHNRVQIRGYAVPVAEADAAPRTHYEQTWEATFGVERKY